MSQTPKHANSPPERVETFQARLHNYSLPAALHQHHYLPPLVALGRGGRHSRRTVKLDMIFGADGKRRASPTHLEQAALCTQSSAALGSLVA